MSAIIERLVGDKREGRIEQRRSPMEGILGDLGRVLAILLALPQFVDIFAEIATCTALSAQGFGADQAPADVGIESGFADTEQVGGFDGG